jgi:hypothetical protein
MMPFAAAVEPHRGWGGPIAILVAFAVIGLIHIIQQRRGNPSPTLSAGQVRSVKTQVTEVPDTDDTEDDTDGGEWWGRIVTINGVRQRVADDDAAAAELVDNDLDLPLDEPEDDSEPETLEGWICANLDRLGYAETVREGVRRWRVSERTVKRRIADRRRG